MFFENLEYLNSIYFIIISILLLIIIKLKLRVKKLTKNKKLQVY